MKRLLIEFYNALGGNEKKVFWFGAIVFSIGFILLIDVLKPPSWFGWKETTGTILQAQGAKAGIFSGGSTTFLIQYQTLEGETIEGTYKISPLILRTMTGLRVFYKANNPTEFYLHNPTKLTIALTCLIFGSVVSLSFYLYYRDKQKGIDYD